MVDILRRIEAWLSRPYTERGTYNNWKEAFLALVGYSIGLGNLWRFPYLCYKYGGATFIITYSVCMLCLGMPLYFMELALGQYVSLGPIQLFSCMSPLFSGVGWGMLLILLLISVYYNVLLAWAVFYMGSSFRTPLPWSHCNNDFNSEDCHSSSQEKFYPAAQDFFNYGVLGKTEVDGWYKMQGWLVLCLAIAWVLVAACLGGGIRGTGKVLYFTVIYPYIILICLFALNYDKTDERLRNLRFKSFSIVSTEKLLHLNIWNDAAGQVIYSLGVALGGITTLASYNSFNHNIIRDSFLICLLESVTSILCGYVFFSSAVVVTDEMIQDSNGISTMAFTTLSALLARIGVPLWSFACFFMILTLGLDSQFVMVEAMITALYDQFKVMRRRHLPVVVATCSVLFILGLPMCTRNGIIVFNLMNVYSNKHSLFMLGLLEVIIVSYIYGFQNMMNIVKTDLRLWVPKLLYWYWAITWQVITPLFLLALTVSSVYSEDWSGGDSPVTFICGQFIAFMPILLVPIFALHKICTRGDQSLRELLNSLTSFCPEYERNGRSVRDNSQNPPENEYYIDNAAFNLQEL